MRAFRLSLLLLLLIPSAAAAAPLRGLFDGTTEEGYAVTLHVARDQGHVKDFATQFDTPSCGGDGRTTFTATKLKIGTDRRFSTTGTAELTEGGTATVKLSGRFDRGGTTAAGTLDVDVDLGISTTPYGSLGGGCARAIAFTTRALRQVHDRFADQEVSLRRGADLELVLSGASPSTGYHWDIVPKPSAFVLDGPKRSLDPKRCPEGQVGCKQNVLLRFRAVRNGKTTLRLVLRAPGRKKPVRRLTLHVRVKPRTK
jgi:predicted secreted protein